ncbi:aminoglycoside phosphotransferase [Fictibacillus macauensis ZFHKF-1]|uniref:Aminoglycoside phosphotransferase n=1 Tax=Fictibacillus macauensis ZFHKF-1 TaxID=1196324 RepID=I8ANQ4_9BACL|nr:phosphotransferase [Fictibacillus macauensis]EIT87459.1 aminoglycoside phosphotransferase [Fictibacillus macauensis ZFHKF-1]
MSDTEYKLEFKNLCQTSQLGELINIPEPISGGLLHRMYYIQTNQGKYAIKLLNPQIMLRPKAMQNYINSEKIANFVSTKIPALPSKKINGGFIQQVDSQFYIVFNWIEGKSLKQDEIDESHCEKIGGILADIHRTDFSELAIPNEKSDIEEPTDWNYYLQKGKENRLEWAEILLNNLDSLYDWNSSAIEASELLSSNMVISHRDLDSKNVMWHFHNPVLIDWESAGFINPMQDLIETAIYWSKNEKGEINKQRFFTFISGYKKRYGELPSYWKLVLANGYLGKLGWLEYSLKRSLGIECSDKEEQQLGTTQVTGTIYDIKSYAKQIPKLLGWLDNEL